MRGIVASLLAIVLAACVPVPVPVDSWVDAPKAPRPGDLVRVQTRAGQRHVFRVYKTEETAFYGVASNNKRYRVPYGTLYSLELRVRETEWELLAPSGRTGILLWP